MVSDYQNVSETKVVYIWLWGPGTNKRLLHAFKLEFSVALMSFHLQAKILEPVVLVWRGMSV
jgi:hypothetical protein